MTGDYAVVGAIYDPGAGYDRGTAYIFKRNQDGADTWGEVTKFTASDAQNFDLFGVSVSLCEDDVLIGAYHEDGDGNLRGAAYMFKL